jgi:WD40 repeat protein
MALLFERLLVDPSLTALRAALRKIVRESNQNRTRRVHELSWPLDDLNGALTDATGTAEGTRVWIGPAPSPWFGAQRIALGMVWWTDHVGRRHLHIRSELQTWLTAWPDFWPEWAAETPLLLLQPHRSFLRVRGDANDLVVFCDCGACGTLSELGWMGACCGPCHDRGESGVEVPRLLPRLPPSLKSLFDTEGENAACVLAFSTDGERLAWGGSHGRVVVWDLARATSEVLREAVGDWARLPPHPRLGEATALTFSRDGDLLAVSCWGQELGVYDTETIRKVGALEGRRHGGMNALAFLGDGERLLCLLEGDLSVWNLDSDRVAPLRIKGIRWGSVVALSADGRWAVTNEGVVLRVWDLEAGTARHHLEHQMPLVGGVLLSPNSRYLAVQGDIPATLRVWDLSKQRVKCETQGEADTVWQLAFSPGSDLLVASDGPTVSSWDVTTGEELARLRWNGAAISCLRFAPDGRMLAVGFNDGRVSLWPVGILQ